MSSSSSSSSSTANKYNLESTTECYGLQNHHHGSRVVVGELCISDLSVIDASSVTANNHFACNAQLNDQECISCGYSDYSMCGPGYMMDCSNVKKSYQQMTLCDGKDYVRVWNHDNDNNNSHINGNIAILFALFVGLLFVAIVQGSSYIGANRGLPVRPGSGGAANNHTNTNDDDDDDDATVSPVIMEIPDIQPKQQQHHRSEGLDSALRTFAQVERELLQPPEIKDMSIKEMRAELKSYGIGTQKFLEKEEFLVALKKARNEQTELPAFV